MTRVGILIYAGVTQLDFTAPFEVLARLPETHVELVAATREPVRSDTGLTVLPSSQFSDCGALDVLLVPGGPGIDALLDHTPTLQFVRAQHGAAWLTAVCTGSLLLGRAGLLTGHRATTHWAYHSLLELFGALPVAERVVFDRNRVTAGGVTSGMDFALALARQLHGEEVAQRLALVLEYDPAPPFVGGHPRTAAPEHVEHLRSARYDARVNHLRALLSTPLPAGVERPPLGVHD